MIICLIVNPVSGRLRYPRQVEWLRQQFRLAGFEPRMKLTSAPLQGIRLAREAAEEGAQTVVAVGGDGTINEVINGIIGTPARLGIIPVGWRNVLARELKIPGRLREALAVIREGNLREIDLGQANDRLFVLMVGAGLDGESVRRVNFGMKRYLGGYAYQLAGLKSLISFRPDAFSVRIDGEGELFGHGVVVSNARYYGGRHQITPQARIDDGYLDLCVFGRGGRWDYLRYYLGVLNRSHHRYRDVCFRRLSSMEIRSPGIPVHADGDFLGFTPLRVRIHPRILPVFVPSAERR